MFNLLGPLLLGAAVANTIATIVEVPAAQTVEVVGAALTAAVTWNVFTWTRGLPSSSSHALIGGLVGAGVVEAGVGAINWGGVGAGHPTRVIGALVGLAVSPVFGFGAAWAMQRGARRGFRRATTRLNPLVRRAQWPTSALLAFSHGANDAQKSVGVLAVLLLANGTTQSLSAPVWTKAASAAALTAGTALGGWPIVRTIGRRLFRIRPLDGLISQSKSEASATDAADAAVKTQRQLERVYRQAASALLEVQDLREVMGRRELYRRVSRISEILTEAADRVWYATVKEG